MKVMVAEKMEQVAVDAMKGLGCEVVVDGEVAPEALGAALTKLQPRILIVRGKKVTGPAITAGADAGLKLIIRAGAGYDSIDTATAARAGVAVCNCPGMNAVAVAELVMSLLLECDRRIADQVAQMRAGQWNKKEYAKARGLKGLTLGIIGVGSIGRAVIQRARAFEMRLIAHSLNMTPQRAADLRVEYGGSARADLHAMAGKCDAVSVHVAANAESEKMCDAAFFGAMKKGSYFINTSRGSVVDEGALAEAIKSKGIRAGLDVFKGEPSEGSCAWNSPIAAMPGVFATHHCGASTDQAQLAVADEVVRIVKIYKETGQFENRVN